jgi:hypothetical protein
MENRIKVFVGAACHKPHKEFTESLSDFLQHCSLTYEMVCYQVYGKQLVDAQNEIADMFLKMNYDYLLMVEDDNWGFSLEMLNALVKADKPVIGVKYYSRHDPHVIIPMRPHPSDPHKGMMELLGPTGIVTVYLVGFGMTLIKRLVFNYLDKPYFSLNEKSDISPDQYATDHNFCHRLMMNGVSVFGLYDYCLTHRGMNDDNKFERMDKMLANSFRHNLRVRDNIRRERLNG